MIEDKIVLCDLDKTLVNMNEHFIEMLLLAFDRREMQYNRNEMCSRLRSTVNLYHELERAGISKNDTCFWDLFNAIDDRRAGIMKKKISLFPYAEEFLQSVKNMKAAIVSDTPWEKARFEIEMLGIDKYIRVFSHWDIRKDGDSSSKPDPFLALDALKKLNADEHDKIYFVGDDKVDIECGCNLEKQLGCNVIKIHVDRYNHCLFGADFTVPDLRYAKEIIEGD